MLVSYRERPWGLESFTLGLVENGGKETGNTRIKGMMKNAGYVVEALRDSAASRRSPPKQEARGKS